MLLNPNHLTRKYPDRRSGEIMAATVDFFESRGKARLKHDDHERIWYSDFLDFVGRERIFASLLTPASYGADDCRWDTYRISEFAEIMGFYGLSYWYPFQVTALGLGPIWMSANEDAKRKAAAGLEAGEVFAFGLSEQTHGADVYQTDMILTPSDGGWTANGEKYYIGNANVARMVSTFGKIAGTPESQEYVFFVADSQHERYDLIKNVVNSQNYVANYALRDYPVTEADILHRGAEAFHAALNTVNVCKYNLGWGAIGMCTHALYESVTHAARSVLHRHYLDVLRPLVRDAHARGDLRADSDTGALMSLLLLIFPHLALAPYMRGLDPILGLDEPTPEQPALAVRRLVAVLAAAFDAQHPATNSAQTRSEEIT